MKFKTSYLALISLVIAGVTHANETTDKTLNVLNKAINAYGGDTLRNLKQLSVTRDGRLAWDGQGYDTTYTNYVTERYDNHFDFTTKDASIERWISQNGGEFHTRNTTTKNGVAYINYLANEYTLNKEGSFEKSFSRSMIYSDILLAVSMTLKPKAFTYLNDGIFEGRPASVLSYKFSKDQEPMKLFIDDQSGYIVKTLIGSGEHLWLMIFKEQTESHGLKYAAENISYYGGKAVDFHVNYTVATDAIPEGTFKVDQGLKKEAEKVGTEGEFATQVKPGVYHIGSDGSYSTFFTNNKFVIGVNTYTGGFKKKNSQFNEQFNPKKLPLKYVIITHHHDDQINGVQEALDEGATLIVTPMAKQLMDKNKELNLTESDVIVVENSLQLGDMHIHMVPTNHVAQYLIVFQNQAKVLYQDDHYYAGMKKGPSHINSGSYELFKHFADLKLSPEIILGGHSPKAEKWDDLKETFTSMSTKPYDYCPTNRRICADRNQ